MEDAVGPVLRMSDKVELVIRAILEDNPDQDVEVIDHGSYVRVQAPAFMRVRLETLQRNLGASFEMRELGSMLSAFAGRIASSSDEMSWSLGTPERLAGAGEGRHE